MNILC
jgi:hypothetical protein